jgi:hypothetical protein
MQYTAMPLALWVTVDIVGDDGRVERHIRPYVARVTGEVMDAREVERPFLCLVPPTFDTHKTVMALLSRESDVWSEAMVS